MNDRIEKTIDIKAPVERVWQALADHQEFGQWFRVRLDGPFVAGEPSRGQMTVPGFEHVPWRAEIKTIEAPHYFSYTWHPYAIDPETDYSGETPTLVEFRLEAVEGGTRLTVTESGFENVPAARRAEALRMNTGGWEAQVKNIRTHAER